MTSYLKMIDEVIRPADPATLIAVEELMRVETVQLSRISRRRFAALAFEAHAALSELEESR